MKKILAVFLSLVISLYVHVPMALAQSQTATLSASSTGCATADSCLVLNLNPSNSGGAFQLVGTFVGTVSFEGTVNGNTWFALPVTPIAGGATATSATGTGMWQFGNAGLVSVRARISAYTSGSAEVTIFSSGGSPNSATATIAGTVIVAGAGTAGSAGTAALTIQGISSGVPVAVTGGSTALPVMATDGVATTIYGGTMSTLSALTTTSGAVITALTITINSLECFNVTGSAATVNRTDTAGLQFETSFSIPANSTLYLVSPGAMQKMVGLKMWAGTASAINCVISARQQ